jgi:small subunit ribosomal protein S3
LGQKTNPVGLRLGIIRGWSSKWFSDTKFADLLKEDLVIRKYTEKRLEHAGIAAVDIIRAPRKVTLDIHTARPGIVIGRKGTEVDKLKEELQLLTKKEVAINIIEVKKPELSAKLVATSIAKQLEGRVSFRRAMKKAISAGMKSGAEGIKISCGGRLAGAEIARTEKYMGESSPAYPARRHRLRHRHGTHDLRLHRGQDVDLQRRDLGTGKREGDGGQSRIAGFRTIRPHQTGRRQRQTGRQKETPQANQERGVNRLRKQPNRESAQRF